MMTVKEFMEKTTGVDEFDIEGKDVFRTCRACNKNDVIKDYGERKIISIHFYVDCYDDRCVDIEIE